MKDKIIQITIAIALTGLLLAVFFLTGCNTAGKAIDSASQKSLIGSGFLAINKITITDTATNTYTPQIFSMFVNGKYVSLLKNSKFLYYDKQSSASTFNASAVTTEENLIIQVDNKETLAGVMAQLVKLQEEAEKSNSSKNSNSSAVVAETATASATSEAVTSSNTDAEKKEETQKTE